MSGIRIFAAAHIIYGIINLFGLGNYKDFKNLLTGYPNAVIFLIYGFGIIYGIMCIFCGSKILKLEDWARRTAVMLVIVSLFLGLFTNPVALKNIRTFYGYGQQFGGADIDTVIKSFLLFAIIFTLYELAFVFYFTRSKIKGLFKCNT
ncbi:MAG: hypothetical protein KAU58_01945 [Candidatus Omnitrophica bacterium]|nr:hypothetical protein [Candidatus Omnitrophota bacterium]